MQFDSIISNADSVLLMDAGAIAIISLRDDQRLLDG